MAPNWSKGYHPDPAVRPDYSKIPGPSYLDCHIVEEWVGVYLLRSDIQGVPDKTIPKSEANVHLLRGWEAHKREQAGLPATYQGPSYAAEAFRQASKEKAASKEVLKAAEEAGDTTQQGIATNSQKAPGEVATHVTALTPETEGLQEQTTTDGAEPRSLALRSSITGVRLNTSGEHESKEPD